MEADRWPNVCTAEGSVKSSAGTYTACIEVMAPVEVFEIPLLESGKLRGQGGLVAEAGGELSHEPRNLLAGLDESENVIDEQQNILPFIIPEILRHRKRGMPDAETRARRFVHLPENHDSRAPSTPESLISL